MTSVLWFRRDLRLHDHPALAAAIEAGPVAPLFVLDPALLSGRWASANRTAFLLASLQELDAALRERGARLHVRIGRPADDVPRFAREVGAAAVFVSRDYSPYARRRDAAVARALAGQGIAFHARRGTLVHEPEDVRGAAGQPLTVFTPFYRAWSALPLRAPLPAPAAIPAAGHPDPGALPRLEALGLPRPVDAVLPAGESAARARLERFLAGPVCAYADTRDRLDLAGTSRLSQDLRFGLLSPLEVVTRARALPCDTAKFVAEVAWREFYHHILWHHPRVLREPFQQAYAAIPWRGDPAAFEAWAAGRTGYPLVDAAMRELAATGYMHNRARMVAASFLAKELLLDWRLGETHFMRHLVDGDVANNDGGWQWAASVGTDPQPYFRIFNPVLQSKKFDPGGVYLRRWLPELRRVPDRYIHEPWTMPPSVQQAAGCVIGRDYPAPIVDHAAARVRAVHVFEQVRNAATTGDR
ncbi:deoxyribodipyrimidine photo-lyase [Tepidiforma flava]|uniref:Deoxyribodipyrimidine photo-lyase n=1 Tax=Tepidiforma flava TaxID=3004094 RepID=A0ABY7M9K1_9CHLR|nr:deoxyribodipyrimidine photo-lyase [Tepidiforma flava]WBL36775.1 deoxyribodipyrimidine photo-lyase [Tepidiforma flava]